MLATCGLLQSEDIPALLPGKNGSVCVNPDKSLIKWRWQNLIVIPGSATSITLQAAGSAGDTGTLMLIVPDSNGLGDFEICGFLATSTSGRRFTIMLEQTDIDRKFMNQPLSNNLFAGTSLLPPKYAEPFFVMAQTTMKMNVKNITAGATNTVQLVAIGRQFFDRGESAERRRKLFLAKKTTPYWLVPDLTGATAADANNGGVTVAAGATADVLATVPSYGDLEALFLMDDSTTAGTLDFRLQIIEGTSGDSLMDASISGRDFVFSPTLTVTGFPNSGVISAASLPFSICGWTHLFRRSTPIVLRVTNNDASDLVFRPGFGGRMILYPEAGLVNPLTMGDSNSQFIAKTYPSPIVDYLKSLRKECF